MTEIRRDLEYVRNRPHITSLISATAPRMKDLGCSHGSAARALKCRFPLLRPLASIPIQWWLRKLLVSLVR